MTAIPLAERRSVRAKSGDELLERIATLEAEQDDLVERLRGNTLEISILTAATKLLGVTRG